MFFPLLCLCSIHFVISLSNQEDLSISNYSQTGCLILKSNKQYLVNNIQENSFLSYQTFSSSHMSIELCFRLCRRWYILTFNNQTNCICLYTINTFYQLNKYLGELVSLKNCRSNHIEIYSLTKDISIFPSLINPELSLDGCYYLQGLHNIRVTSWVNHVDYIQAIDLCQKSCQMISNTTSYSFFLSGQKSCRCLPIDYSLSLTILAVRKPLKYCSFIPYICNISCEKYSLEMNLDTLIKINVQHYCLTFLFDRMLYSCLKLISFSKEINNKNSSCLPLVIKTFEQWNYLIQSSWILYSKTIISIDRNSTYIFKKLIQMKNKTLLLNDLCIVINRNEFNKSISLEFIQCSLIHSSGYILCAQKPLETRNSYKEELQMINNESELPSDEILTCPPEFMLFNKMCYFIHTSSIHNIQNAERACFNQSSNSSLVKFDSHEWNNVNATRFLGRMFNDILLEFFYYQLEKKLINESTNNLTKINWLRLLLGDKNDPNKCFLRYFTRLTRAFTIHHRCSNGGNPVCQSQPIRKKISINSQIESIFTETTQITTLNSSDLLTIPNEIICENCKITVEYLLRNESYNTTSIMILSTQSESTHSINRLLLIILTGPGLSLLILLVGIIFLMRYFRQNRRSYSTNSSITGQHRRTTRSSTILTISDMPNTPAAALYTRLKPLRLNLTERDAFDNSTLTEDQIELLSTTKQNNKNDEEPLNGIQHT